jgi:hypothetical protein
MESSSICAGGEVERTNVRHICRTPASNSANNRTEKQRASLGCNIKWKTGSEPDYFNPLGVQASA